jgi:hypothetical protein
VIEAQTIYHGGCLCGAVRYRIDGPSLFETQCCCRDCQKATGSGHTTIIGLHRSQLSIAGPVATYTNAGESGGSVTRHFCGTCAGRIYTSGSLPGEMIMVQAGSLDTPDAVEPQSVIYRKQAVAWDHFDPAIPRFDDYEPFSDETKAAMAGDMSKLRYRSGAKGVEQ